MVERVEMTAVEVSNLQQGMLDLEFASFLAVVRYQTFSQAAEYLNVTQSTVSYRLKALEQRLGLTLVDRGRGRQAVRLTADGEELLKLAERWEALHLDIQQLSRRGAVLGIGAPDSVNTYVLGPAYAEMAARHPELRLRVVTANSRELYKMLDRHEIDIAFPLYSRPSPDLSVHELLREPMVVVTGGDLPTNEGVVRSVDLDPLEEVQLGWPDPISGSRVSPRGISKITVDVTHLVLPFLANTRKWVVLPESMAIELSSAGCWRIYPLADPEDGRTIFKVVRRRLPRGTQQNLALFQQYLAPAIDSAAPRRTAGPA